MTSLYSIFLYSHVAGQLMQINLCKCPVIIYVHIHIHLENASKWSNWIRIRECLTIWETARLFQKWLWLYCFSSLLFWKFHLLHFPVNAWTACFKFSHSNKYISYHTMILICISVIMTLSIFSVLAGWLAVQRLWLSTFSHIFPIFVLLGFLLLCFENCIFWTQSLYWLWNLQIFFQAVTCFSHSLKSV